MRCQFTAIATGAALIILVTPPAPAWAQAPSDSAAVVTLVERYHRALVEADTAVALDMLAEDALILEGGEIESRREYGLHHLPADIAFAHSVKEKHSLVRVSVRGDVAWTTATSTIQGRYRGKPVSSYGAELMVLTRTADGWRISAIHWSSRNRS